MATGLTRQLNDRIYLTGYRGTGKTTIAGLISRQLGTDWVDLDVVIEAKADRTIEQIFAEGGEGLFRDWESRCLSELAFAASDDSVVALGGGAILRGANRDVIRQTGVCIWLTAQPETILARTSADASTTQRRPALTNLSPIDEIRSLLAAREPLYREIANGIVATDNRPPQQIADEIANWLEGHRLPSGGYVLDKRPDQGVGE